MQILIPKKKKKEPLPVVRVRFGRGIFKGLACVTKAISSFLFGNSEYYLHTYADICMSMQARICVYT